MATGTVYLIHLNSPLGHARHYIGWSQYVKARFHHHKSGTGARMLAAANRLGIDYKIVRTWPGDRTFERLLKNRKNAPAIVPSATAPIMTTQQETVFNGFLATLDEPYIALAYQTRTHLELSKARMPETNEEWRLLVNPDEDDLIEDEGEYYL